MSDQHHIKQVMQFALLSAAQAEDFYERELSPLQLIKYVYLVDMAYAKHHEGRTFTGLPWKFHHFGPWSVEAFLLIDEALTPLRAQKTMFQSKFGDKDCVRWRAEFDEAMFESLRQALPLEVKQSVGRYVGQFKNNTATLLHFVYATPPMLNAAPEEILDFSTVVKPIMSEIDEFIPLMERLTKKKRKALRSGMADLHDRFQQAVESRKQTTKPYSGQKDEVFASGMAWLDELAGAPFPEEGATVRFSDEVWRSKARSGDV